MGTTIGHVDIGAGAALFNFNSRSRIPITNNNYHRQISELNFGGSRRNVNLEFGRTRIDGGFRMIGHKLTCKAVEQSQSSANTNTNTNTSVYQGVYGPWTIEPSDVREVILYRSGLVTAALSFVVASSPAYLPDNTFLNHNLDAFYLLGSAGLGLSLYLIHIYVTEIKRTLQALWALGVFGSILAYTALAQPAGEGLVQYVVDNPTAVWLVGPVFAALTGLVFKEGLCYGKWEAAVLTFIIPITLLGHLTGILDDSVKLSLLGVWMALFIIFAGRKFTQPVKKRRRQLYLRSLSSEGFSTLRSAFISNNLWACL